MNPMMMKRRNGQSVPSSGGQDRLLSALYGNVFGRLLLRPLVSPIVSKAAGKFLSSGASRFLIEPFIRSNNIDMEPFEPGPFSSYNEFFSRKIKPGARPVDMEPSHLIAPCDSKLTAMKISPDSRFHLKHTEYTLSSLLKSDELAARFSGGWALIFRLTVDDYHRYCYICDGEKSENIRIPGVLHTVNPIANDHYPIYKENSREYSILRTASFGEVLMMEVGALLVGKIVNHHGKASVRRGQEKGYFQFGGSTVVLLLQSDRADIDEDILENSRSGVETVVRMGERIGWARSVSDHP